MKLKLSDNSLQMAILVTVALVGTALAVFANTLPQQFSSTGNEPPLALLATFGLVVMAGMGLILLVLTKLGLGLSRSVMFSVFAFNAAIILVKFVLSPLGLYGANATEPFQEGGNGFLQIGGITNAQGGFTSAAIASGIAYLVALWVIYRFTKPKEPKSAQPSKFGKKGLTVLALVALGIAFGFQFIAIPLLFIIGPLGDYLSKLGPTLSSIFLVLGIGVVLAVIAFKTAANEANQLRRPMLFATLFWLCISLLLMYHVLWVVFMTALVSIWPFKTVVPPSSK